MLDKLLLCGGDITAFPLQEIRDGSPEARIAKLMG